MYASSAPVRRVEELAHRLAGFPVEGRTDKFILGDFKRHLPRLFKATTVDSSNVGKTGHQSSKTWLKWYAKYREPCIRFIALKRPQWKNEAEDVVQRVAAKIAGDPYITDRGEDDTCRTVICNMCLSELSRIHNPHQAKAARKFNRLNAVLALSCHMANTQAEERVLERAKALGCVE